MSHDTKQNEEVKLIYAASYIQTHDASPEKSTPPPNMLIHKTEHLKHVDLGSFD